MDALNSIADARLNKLVSITTRTSRSYQTEVYIGRCIYSRAELNDIMKFDHATEYQLREYVNMVNKQVFYLFSSPDKGVILTQELTAEMLILKLSATCSGS